MSVLFRPVKWFYHEFGIASIQETGRNAYLIILARSCRMFAYGTNSLILGMLHCMSRPRMSDGYNVEMTLYHGGPAPSR